MAIDAVEIASLDPQIVQEDEGSVEY